MVPSNIEQPEISTNKMESLQKMAQEYYSSLNRTERRKVDRKAAKAKKANLKNFPARVEYEKLHGNKDLTFTQQLNKRLIDAKYETVQEE